MKLRKMSPWLVAIVAGILLISVWAPSWARASDDSTIQRNKEIVKNFYEEVFTKHNVAAALDYQKEGYIQHNPFVPTGRQGFQDAMGGYLEKHPELRVTIKRILAEGDFVIVHNHWQDHPSDRGSAIIDIFRVEDGKIAEHWDVVQPIPEKSANDNGIF